MSRLERLLEVIDASGGGITLRPTGATVFAPRVGRVGWLNHDVKRQAGETMAALAERALDRAVARWKF